ncbi:MAG TPA: YlmH/Sll1252 family protein [Clostridia bacterium]
MAKSDPLLSRKILDLLETAEKSNRLACTRFLTPAELLEASIAAKKAGWLPAAAGTAGYFFYGGYENAERRRMFVFPFPADVSGPLASMDPETYFCIVEAIAGRPGDPGPGHRDILGALMSIGIRRDAVGDILVDTGKSSAWMILDPTVAQLILQNLEKIGHHTVRFRELSLSDFRPDIPEGQTVITTGTVASLRLDAVAALAFGIARADMASRIRHGDVQVNWVECADPDRLLAEGDRMALRGTGKAVLTDIGGKSRKGRSFLTIERPK